MGSFPTKTMTIFKAADFLSLQRIPTQVLARTSLSKLLQLCIWLKVFMCTMEWAQWIGSWRSNIIQVPSLFMVTSDLGNPQKTSHFQYVKGHSRTDVNLVKCVQVRGNIEKSCKMFDHVKWLKNWTTLACHVYNSKYYKVLMTCNLRMAQSKLFNQKT